MSKKNVNEPDELQKVESALGKTETFIENNIKQLGIGVLVIAVIVAGFILFRSQYIAPRETRAQEQIFRGEMYFAVDSFRLALEGNGVDYIGFKSIINQYGITRTANLAKAYAGISYYKLGDYKIAEEYLKGFDADDKIGIVFCTSGKYSPQGIGTEHKRIVIGQTDKINDSRD